MEDCGGVFYFVSSFGWGLCFEKRFCRWETLNLENIPHWQCVISLPWESGWVISAGIYGNTQAAWFASGKATFQEEYVADIPEYGFNEYLQMGVELGGIGLSLFMLVLVIAYRHLFHIRGKEGVIGGLTCWGIFAWFSYPLSVLPLVVTLVMLLALSSPSVSLRSRKLNWGGHSPYLHLSFTYSCQCSRREGMAGGLCCLAGGTNLF